MPIDPVSGVYVYAATDPSGPMVDVLNLGQNADKAARTADRERLDALEALSVKAQPQPTPVGSGMSVDANLTAALRAGNLYFLSLALRNASGFPGGGTTIAKIPAGGRPPQTLTRTAVASQGGAANGAVVLTVTDSGDVRCWTTLSSNTLLELQGFWLAVS